MNDCGNSFRSQFASIPGVAVWAVFPGTFATHTSEVSTDLGKQVLGEDICGPNIMFGKKKIPMSVTGCCLAGLMAPLQRGFFWHWVAAKFVLSSGVDGMRFALRR